MIKHIVLWTFKESAEGKAKSVNLKETKALLEGLKGTIKEVKRLEVGINFNPGPHAYDLALYSEFSSKEDLLAYTNHPEHQKVVEHLGKVRDQRIVVDYEIE
jgi:Stress responsive A/B Barrel Domain